MARINDQQKKAIQSLRSAGMGYKSIAARLSLPLGTVKSYCARKCGKPKHSLSRPRPSLILGQGEPCKECGQLFTQVNGAKKRLFCSDKCRQIWWNKHPEMLHRKALYPFVCAQCGGEFQAYGNNHRKYCSRGCYVAARFAKKAMTA